MDGSLETVRTKSKLIPDIPYNFPQRERSKAFLFFNKIPQQKSPFSRTKIRRGRDFLLEFCSTRSDTSCPLVTSGLSSVLTSILRHSLRSAYAKFAEPDIRFSSIPSILNPDYINVIGV